jgi:hypothetical protein
MSGAAMMNAATVIGDGENAFECHSEPLAC